MPPRTIFVPNDLDGTGFYRCIFPMFELRKRGWDALIPPHDIVEHSDYDYWEVKSGARPLKKEYSSSSMVTYLGDLEADLWVLQRSNLIDFKGARYGKKVIGDQDDSFNMPRWHRANLTRKTHEKMVEGYRNVDAMTVSTPQLAEDYADHCDNIYVLRNYLDWEMWENVEQQSEVERPGGRVRVGWMGAYDFHQGDVHLLRGVVGPWLERHPNVDFVVAGPKPDATHEVLGVPKDQRVSIDGVAFGSGRLPEITAVMDVGLVPLEMSLFNEAKSHLKGMEYAACGIPCIASPTESYRYWIEDGVNGLFASKPQEWRNALESFVDQESFRRECGRNARRKAGDHTIQKHIGEWIDVYMEVCGGGSVGGVEERVRAAC